MDRSPEDAIRDHGRAVNSGDLQAILGDYAEDAVILTARVHSKERQALRRSSRRRCLCCRRCRSRRNSQ